MRFVRFVYRWMANSLAFYLALYLVDSVIGPRFYLETGWAAIVLAILMGALNSLIRPFPRFRTKRNRALTVVGLTIIANAIFMQIFIWVGAPLSTTNPVWLIGTAVFLTLLAALLNWIVGFKPKEGPKVVTRQLGVGPGTTEREDRKEPRPRKRA